jgi:serine/threonine-protein kinase
VNDDDGAPPPGFLGDRRRQAIAGIIGVIVVIAIVFTGVWWFTGGPGAYTRTPSVIGLRTADAERLLTGKGLKSRVGVKAFSSKIAPGQIISSDPGDGDKVKKDGTVVLTESKGLQLIAVPDVAGKSQSDATKAIKASGLKVGRISKKFSDSVAEGNVVSTSPKTGSKIAPDRSVAVVVSKGAAPIALPNVVNQQIDAATAQLQGLGLKVNATQTAQIDGRGPGTVLSQDPAPTQPGQTVAKGSTVNLTVVQQPQPIPVPNVVNQDFGTAQQTLQAAGFQVQRDGWNPLANTVRSQSVTGQAVPGTVIVLKVAF